MADQTNHVGPIIFADETARAQLVDEGEVVTFRKTQRTTGDTWWRKSRTGPKEGDVVVEEIGEAAPIELELRHFWELSGFDSVFDWQDAIKELNGELPETGYLYRCTRKDRIETPDGWDEAPPEQFEDRLFVSEVTYTNVDMMTRAHVAVYEDELSVEVAIDGRRGFHSPETMEELTQLVESEMERLSVELDENPEATYPLLKGAVDDE